MNHFSAEFMKALGEKPQESVLLKDYSHFRIGGRADYFFEAHTLSGFEACLALAREMSQPFYVIGGGYNILFDDKGFRGLIIKNSVKGINEGETFKVEVLSGTTLEEMLQFCREKELEGFEFLAGIPGTVGGGLYSNAGAFDQGIGDLLEEALVIQPDGKKETVGRDFFDFRYRHSLLGEKRSLLLKAVFFLKPGNVEEIEARIRDNLKSRRDKHPSSSIACAGSYFKNPVLPTGKKVPAAALLDEVGAKRMRSGGAAVYSGHANFIINSNNATSEDVRRLAFRMKKKVKAKFGIVLREEVIFVPEVLPEP
ncbi:MAG: UDP-N-acetylmuramate dehydrogenase [Candidatus Aminicenantes bacterium]|nr:UDP-N-acetylmuramate dehydrogenase [Candidatus Aminicenantes bacterium]